MTKKEANYRYPDECCGKCKGAYRNSYGDAQCSCLEPGNSIDLGGVCDLFVPDDADLAVVGNVGNSVDGAEVVQPEIQDTNRGSCTICKHSYFDRDAGKPMCDVDNGEIVNVNDICGAFEEEWYGSDAGASIVPTL